MAVGMIPPLKPRPGTLQTRGSRRGVAAVVALLAACAPAERGPTAVIHTANGPVRVALEVAATPAAVERGLMWRTDLADGHGMLFVFPDEQEHSFWMKNTLIPLDMIFIAQDGRVAGVHAEAKPLSTAPISVGRPSRWVLEVPGGWAKRHGVASGDRVELQGVTAD
jgi:uncharacterized membrane protein (UPF0127 family)